MYMFKDQDNVYNPLSLNLRHDCFRNSHCSSKFSCRVGQGLADEFMEPENCQKPLS
jgi:hypothetical protein